MGDYKGMGVIPIGIGPDYGHFIKVRMLDQCPVTLLV